MKLAAGVLVLLAALAPIAHAQPVTITISQPAEATTLELFQEVIVYGVSRRVSFKPRPDYRLIVSEMAASR